LEKKEAKKLFLIWDWDRGEAWGQAQRSFLLLFYKKEVLDLGDGFGGQC
jgi:hypothetical protein